MVCKQGAANSCTSIAYTLPFPRLSFLSNPVLFHMCMNMWTNMFTTRVDMVDHGFTLSQDEATVTASLSKIVSSLVCSWLDHLFRTRWWVLSLWPHGWHIYIYMYIYIYIYMYVSSSFASRHRASRTCPYLRPFFSSQWLHLSGLVGLCVCLWCLAFDVSLNHFLSIAL